MESFSTDWHTISIKTASLTDIEPELSILTAEEKNRYSQIKALSRKKEFYASRALVSIYLSGNRIRYTEHGKPFLTDSQYAFSISHSKQYASIAFSETHKNIAIDIEGVRPRIINITSKFINSSESDYIDQSRLILFATIIWSAKETMFKIFENGSFDFIKHYTISPFSLDGNGEFYGIYTGSGIKKTISMKYWIINETVIVAGHE